MDAITQIPHPSNETPRDYRPNSPGRADSEVALNALSLDQWTCSDDDLDGVLGVFRARVSGSGVGDPQADLALEQPARLGQRVTPTRASTEPSRSTDWIGLPGQSRD